MPDAERHPSERALLTLAGGLLLGGFLFFYVVTELWHPSGQENNHPVIFTSMRRATSGSPSTSSSSPGSSSPSPASSSFIACSRRGGRFGCSRSAPLAL